MKSEFSQCLHVDIALVDKLDSWDQCALKATVITRGIMAMTERQQLIWLQDNYNANESANQAKENGRVNRS